MSTITDYIYGERAPSLGELEQMVKRRQEMLDCQREVYEAESNCRGLNAATAFSLNGHKKGALNGDYLVVSLQHEGNQSSLFAFGGGRKKQASGKTLTYHNTLSLLKKDVPYRPLLDSTRRPLMVGGQIAKTETSGGDYAYLDDAGRYRIKSLFEDATHEDAAASLNYMPKFIF